MEPSKPAEILIASDDLTFAQQIAHILREDELVTTEMSPERVLHQGLTHHEFRLLIVAIVVESHVGVALCEQVKNQSGIPIILLLPPERHLDGIEAGADFCLPLDSDPKRLMTHVRALLRRSGPASRKGGRSLRFDGFRIDMDRRQLFAPDGSIVKLLGAEFEILLALCRHPGTVLSRATLLDATHIGLGRPLERSIDVHICRLRRSLSKAQANAGELIQTVRLGGYALISSINPE